ncbi:hypothetical protein HanXRQr2_Chr01g0042771 [Helianthus annuus]|uniref:Uncharacterized protein n=1 Tax=Helianthus annuus TaxID=4232 RepID=A0A251VS81_HELAN|nr:hypothetical protein HanXRQr2_Chr01g0042771 [Helianthus annuus]
MSFLTNSILYVCDGVLSLAFTSVERAFTFLPNFVVDKSTMDSNEVTQNVSSPSMPLTSHKLSVCFMILASSESGLTENLL